MAILTKPVVIHETDLSITHVFSLVPILESHPQVLADVLATAISLGATPDRICILQPARGPGYPGFKQIKEARFGMKTVTDRLQADGSIVTTPGDALVLTTRDCAGLVLENRSTGAIGLGHCGREAMRPPATSHDLAQLAMSLVQAIEPARKRGHVQAFVSNSICPDCFLHDLPYGQKLIEDFVAIFGDEIFVGDAAAGKLHMLKMIKWLLNGRGIPAQNISINTDCPCCNPGRSSYRGGDTDHDEVSIVIKKHTPILQE